MDNNSATIAILNHDDSISMIYSLSCSDDKYINTLNNYYYEYYKGVELIHLGNISTLKALNTDIVSFRDRINHKLGIQFIRDVTIPNTSGYERHLDFASYTEYKSFIMTSVVRNHYYYGLNKFWIKMIV